MSRILPGRNRDIPLLLHARFLALGAGSATDGADLVMGIVPRLSDQNRMLSSGQNLDGFQPLNRMRARMVEYVQEGGSVTAGVAAHSYDLRVNLYRLGVLQGCTHYYSLACNTTLSAGVAASVGGVPTLTTPASMAGIANGMTLLVDAGGANPEYVYATNIVAGGTTFAAVYRFAHLASATITAATPPYRQIAMIPTNGCNTTASTITAGANVVVTPASMYGIHVGDTLLVSGGTGAAENPVVTAVTALTFTATFANTHSGGFTISSAGVSSVRNFQEGDVITCGRLSNDTTGLASPVGHIFMDWDTSSTN